MESPVLTAMVVGLAVVGSANVSIPQAPEKGLLQRLGPEPLWAPPPSLAALVERAEAAVIAVFAAPGELRLEAAKTPRGMPLGDRAYARYLFVIAEVLYNRMDDTAPGLVQGSTVEFTQLVGQQQAEKFLARDIPVGSRDQCLLFLWHRPGAAEWSILQWPLQFRKSQAVSGTARPMGHPGELEWLGAMWLGPSVPLTTPDDVPTVFWEQLVSEVRRLAALGKAAAPKPPR